MQYLHQSVETKNNEKYMVIENIKSNKYISNALLPISYKKYVSSSNPLRITFYENFLECKEEHTEYDCIVVELDSQEKWLFYLSRACLLYKNAEEWRTPSDRFIYINVPDTVSKKLDKQKYYDFNDIPDCDKKKILRFHNVSFCEDTLEDIWSQIFNIYNTDKIVSGIWSFLHI